MPNYGVEASQRMVMCETGNAMISARPCSVREQHQQEQRCDREANDGTAVENPIPVTYAFLPVPTHGRRREESCYGNVD